MYYILYSICYMFVRERERKRKTIRRGLTHWRHQCLQAFRVYRCEACAVKLQQAEAVLEEAQAMGQANLPGSWVIIKSDVFEVVRNEEESKAPPLLMFDEYHLYINNMYNSMCSSITYNSMI